MKNVFFHVGDRGIGTELLDQLRLFGIAVLEVASVADISRLVSAFGGGLFVADSARLERDTEFVSDLLDAKRELGSSLRVMFYADRDDFDIRLKVVRAGGESFFQLPMDAPRLLDRIDALFSENQPPPYHVLIVDDDPEQRAGMITSVATDPSRVIPILVEAKPEIILMDMYMPTCTGPELAALIRQNEAFAAIPIIFLSVERDFEKQISAIEHGGDEFLEKPIKPEHLVASIAMRAERTRSIRFYMERDSLTGLLNHTHLTERLTTELLRARRAGSVCSFGMIDLDNFKDVNDRFGHLTGDRVLRSLARLLSERLRRTDIVGRYGGEEFGVILPGADGRRALHLLDELRASFARISHGCEADEFHVTFSCGLATYPEVLGTSPLVEAADRALYRAKAEGRDRVVLIGG
jgi:diguanylate cyclase (GGDEF)-like protein